jgi:hypothetical protein
MRYQSRIALCLLAGKVSCDRVVWDSRCPETSGSGAAGIAYDDATGRLFVTGKYWPRLYEVKPRLQSASPNPLELLDARRRCVKSNSGF